MGHSVTRILYLVMVRVERCELLRRGAVTVGDLPQTAGLVDLVNTMDPTLVAIAFGMEPEAAVIYLADHVDPTRLPTNDTAS
jgi:hypothetical protein